MGRRHDDQSDGLMHTRLLNWGRWAYGNVVHGYPAAPVDSPDPIESDAREMEAALLVMKQRRKRLYRVIWVRYITGRDDILGADRLRMSVSTYQGRMRAAYSWLHGYFEREAA